MSKKDIALPPRTMSKNLKFLIEFSAQALGFGGFVFLIMGIGTATTAMITPAAVALFVGLLIAGVLFRMKRLGWCYYDHMDLQFYQHKESIRQNACKAWAELSLMPAVQQISRVPEPNLRGWKSQEARELYAATREQIHRIDALMLELANVSPTIDKWLEVNNLAHSYAAATREIQAAVRAVIQVSRQCHRLELPPSTQAKLAAREMLAGVPGRLRNLQVPVKVTARVQTRPLRSLRPQQQACGKRHF